MAANTALLVFADASPIDVLRSYPVLDKAATRVLVERLFPGAVVEEAGDVLLADALDPPEDVAYVGCFNNLDVVCGWSVVADRPSQLSEDVRNASQRRAVRLVAMHGDADWCMYGVWEHDELTRAFSACPDPGVMEDVGERLPFEEPFLSTGAAGAGPAGLPFDPDELGKAALRHFFGFSVDGNGGIDDVDPEVIPMVGYHIVKPENARTSEDQAGAGAL
jgi:hypothetical protein